MAITFPLNLLDDMKGIGWSTDFELVYRQEQSGHASGRIRVKDFGTPIWTATYATKNLRPNQVDFWRARLSTLENGLNTFYAYPLSRCWPIDDPNGTKLSGAGPFLGESLFLDFTSDYGYTLNANTVDSGPKLISIGSNRKSLQVSGLPIGYVLNVGDYIQVGNNLHQIVERAEAISGTTKLFEIRPHLSFSADVNSTIKLSKPGVIMSLIPGSVNSSTGINGRGSISFRAIESRG